MRIVTDEDHLILITDRGKLIRMRVTDIPVQGRATQGVRVMRVDDGEHVAAIERLAEPGDESGIAEAAPIEAVDDTDTVPERAWREHGRGRGRRGRTTRTTTTASDEGGEE